MARRHLQGGIDVAFAPTKVFFDKTWKLPDIEQIADSTLKVETGLGRRLSQRRRLRGRLKQLTKRWGIPLYGSMT